MLRYAVCFGITPDAQMPGELGSSGGALSLGAKQYMELWFLLALKQ